MQLVVFLTCDEVYLTLSSKIYFAAGHISSKKFAGDRNLRVLDSRNFSPVMVRDKPCSLKMFWSKFGLKRDIDDCYMKVKLLETKRNFQIY